MPEPVQLKKEKTERMWKFLALALGTAAYAGWLNTPEGRRFADEHTAESVVIGTLIVLAVLRGLIPAQWWWRVVAAFGVAGAPMVARSWLNRGIAEI